ncbi:MAG: hypothetical protein IJY28_01985 [Clostridia bacterium]|nr:hypothetical protein [Clostridia bacterium]
MRTYRVRTDIYTDEIGKSHTVYGIELADHDRVVVTVPDLFFKQDQAEAFAELCNRCELDPMHLMEVIDNELAKI